MNRRRLLLGAATSFSLPLSGCAWGAEETDDDEFGDDGENGGDDPSDGGVPGRIDPLGHALSENPPFYTGGSVSPGGEWAAMGSFPTDGGPVASTLVDLADVEEPAIVHELAASAPATRTNDVEFDALRDGLYYRSQEADSSMGREGIEVVDFGWRDGSPEEPTVVASLETPNTGVHRIEAHPEEPVLYLVDHDRRSDGLITVNVSSPDEPEIVHVAGPVGGCHDVEYDPEREALHAAYILGEAEGYAVYDASEPDEPSVLGHFEYAGRPDYAEIGEPGFEMAHQAAPDPERDLAIVGDETITGVPGGKHVFDVGWDEGSLEEPRPIGFTHAPDARRMDDSTRFWWTTHFHDVVHDGEESLLVDGGYRQGAWVCNITDPRDPTPTERYATVAGADRVPEGRDGLPGPASPPFAWEAIHHEGRDVVFVPDSLTGAYTFAVSAEAARGDDGRGPDGYYDLEAVLEDDGGAGGGHEH